MSLITQLHLQTLLSSSETIETRFLCKSNLTQPKSCSQHFSQNLSSFINSSTKVDSINLKDHKQCQCKYLNRFYTPIKQLLTSSNYSRSDFGNKWKRDDLRRVFEQKMPLIFQWKKQKSSFELIKACFFLQLIACALDEDKKRQFLWSQIISQTMAPSDLYA